MPVQFFPNFEQSQIDMMKNHLVQWASKNTAKFYEIYVDNLKVVPKTDNPEEFEIYEDYVTPRTNFIKLIIYCSGSSPRNDKFFFSYKARDEQEAVELSLDGVVIKTYSEKQLKDIKLTKKIQTVEGEEIKVLKKQLADSAIELKDKQDHIDRCEKGLLIARENGNKIGGVDASELLTKTVNGIIKHNSKAIEKVMGVDGLAGVIEFGNSASPPPPNSPDSEVNFKSTDADSDAVALTEQEKEFLRLCKLLQSHFTEPEMSQVMSILDILSKDKTQIKPVIELLQ